MLRQKFDFWNGNESLNHVFANLKPRFPRGGGGGGGVLLGIFGGEIMSLLLRLERKQKMLQIHLEFAYFSLFLTHLEFKR